MCKENEPDWNTEPPEIEWDEFPEKEDSINGWLIFIGLMILIFVLVLFDK